MNRLSFFLAWRYLRGSQRESSISAMLAICFIGIFIGSFALAVVASVMNGFEHVTHEKMQGIHSQILIHSDGQAINAKKIGTVLRKEFPEIAAFSSSGETQAILRNQETEEIHDVVWVRGIDPKNEPTISSLEQKIIGSPGKKLSEFLSSDNVLLGAKLAQNIEIGPGEPITLFIAEENSIRGKRIKLDSAQATVGGTFATGIDEFDSNCIFCSLNYLKKLAPDVGVTQIGVKLHEYTDENITIQKLRNRLNLTVHSWKNMYPALVSALKLEKYAMFLILALITLVASMNIISLMFMQITKKRGDIAILKAMGMEQNCISRIFLLIGLGIAGISSLAGLGCAFLAGWVLEHYPFIELPDAYYVSHLPSRMTVPIFIAVFLVVMLLSFLATWFTARRTNTINISHVLRFEG